MKNFYYPSKKDYKEHTIYVYFTLKKYEFEKMIFAINLNHLLIHSQPYYDCRCRKRLLRFFQGPKLTVILKF